MRYISNAQIDKARWDALIDASTEPRIYTRSWYLDATCGVSWDALVWGDYEAVMPLYITKRFFMKKVSQPWFTQQTGLCWKKGEDPSRFLHQFFESRHWKKFYSFQCNFHSGVQLDANWVKRAKAQVTVRKNYVLDLSLDYPRLYRCFNENRRRNLKKSSALGWKCMETTDIDLAVVMYKENQAEKQEGLAERVFTSIKNIYKTCLDRGIAELYVSKNANEEVLAYAFFVRDEQRLYYLFGTMNREGRAQSAISILFDHVIKKYAGQDLKLDFEGGNLESIGNYFASWGATVEEYASLSRKRF